MFKFLPIAVLSLAVALAADAAAQTTTGTISGRVADAQGLPLPGVTVTAASSNLQGTRTAVTSANGDYIFTGLPSGTYKLTFELSGFQTAGKTMDLAPTQTFPVDMTLGVAAVSENVTVEAAIRRRPDPDRAGRHQLQTGYDRRAADQPRHQRHSAAGAGGSPHRSRAAPIRLPARCRSRRST